MLASITFPISNLIFGITNEGLGYNGKCRAEFIDTSPDSYPLRGDVTFLNRIPPEVSLKVLEDGGLNKTLFVRGLDEFVAQKRAEGYASNEDAAVIRYWPADEKSSEMLSISCAISRTKFNSVQAFLSTNFGRTDLSGRITMTFYGFNETPQPNPDLPSKAEFLEGRPYFLLGPHSFTFVADTLPE